MYDTSAKSDWDTLQNLKVEGMPGRERLEALKKRIEKPAKKEEEEKRMSPKLSPERPIEEKVKEEDTLSNFEDPKVPKKPFRLIKDSIKEVAKNNFPSEEAKVSIRPEFDNLRLKIRDEVSDKITLSAKLLQKTGEEQMLNAFMKNHAKIKKVKTDYQRHENPKDLDFEPDDKRDIKLNFDMEEEFVDFKKINQDKVDRIVKEQLNRKFPNEIDNIQKLEEKKYVLLTNNNKGQEYRKNDVYGIYPQLDKKPAHQEDIIESYSVVVDKASKLQPIPFYRELGPYARDVVNIKNESKLKNNKLALDLMDEKEFLIDDGNITFENIINIVTGRISGKRLKKILNRLDYTECSDDGREEVEDIDDYVPTQGKKNFEELHKHLEKEKSLKAARAKEIEYISSLHHQHQFHGKERYDPDGLFENLEHSDHEEKQQALEQVDEYLDNYQPQEDFERIESQAEHQNQYPQQRFGIIHPIMASRSSVAVEDYAQQFPTPKEEEEIKLETGETLPNKAIIQLSSEDENTNRPNSTDTNVNTLLREIESLKEAKSNADKLPKLPKLLEFRQQLYNRIEDKLAQLLYMIADDADRKKSLKENLTEVIRDIHLLEGKVIDGHFKKNLLFQFLKEYKKLIEEKEELRKEIPSEFETMSMLNEGEARTIRPEETGRTHSEAFQTHTERIFSSSGQEKKRNNEKLSAQNTLKSQKLPQPAEVRSHYMKQTQSSLRRLQDNKGNNVKPKPKNTFQERQNDVWIGGNNEEISDDDDWVQIDPYR